MGKGQFDPGIPLIPRLLRTNYRKMPQDVIDYSMRIAPANQTLGIILIGF